MGGTVTVRNLDIVIVNIQSLSPANMSRLRSSLEQAGKVLEEGVRNHAQLMDHSLKKLAEMGHPYARRLPMDSGPHPDQMIHIQSGLLYKNVEKVVELSGNHALVAVGIDERKVPYIGYLIYGTSKMRPRDFLGFAWMERRAQVLAIIQFGLTPNLGTRGGTVHN